MKISEIADSVNRFFKEVLNQKCRVLSIEPKDKEYEVRCEVNIDPDYTTKRGLGDIVEIYNVVVNSTLEIVSFSLKETKRKAALDDE